MHKEGASEPEAGGRGIDETLRASEARYRLLFDRNPDGVFAVDSNGRFTIANAACETIAGYPLSELLDKTFMDLCAPDHLERVVERFQRALTEGFYEPLECAIIRKNGQRVDLWIAGEPIISDGKPVALLCTAKNITRRNQVEQALAAAEQRDVTAREGVIEALRRSELFYRQTLESIPGMVFTTRPDGYCDYQSRQWETYTGVPMDEHLGDGWNRLLHPDDRERAFAVWRAAVEDKAPYDLEYRVRRHDGNYEWFKVIGRPIRDAGGAIVRWFGVALNVEDLKRAEAALKESDEQLRRRIEELEKLMDLAPVAIWVAHDPECHWITGNRTANEFYEAASGENVSADPPPGESPAPRRFFREGRELAPEQLPMQYAAAHGVEVRGAELEVLLPSGRRMFMFGSASPLRDAEGRVRGCLGAFLDITRLKEFEKELERSVGERTRELREVNEQLNAFCYSIAHDLKAPLRAQIGFAGMLEEDFREALGEIGCGYARRIAEAADRQSRLIGDLLSHMGLARGDMPMVPVDLESVVDLARRDLDLEVQQKQADVRIGPLHGRVIANASSLHLMIVNLLSNALKFVPHGTRPEVRIWTERLEPDPAQASNRKVMAADGMIRVWVEDNGIGIPAEHRERVFGVFQRLHADSTYPGTGMGLAIVKKAAERMGGRVGVESEPGKGSRFWVELRPAPSEHTLSESAQEP